MVKSYLKIAFRNFCKHKAFASINIVGLAVGLTCCLLILLFIRYELSFDRFHARADRIHRVIMDQRWNPWQGKSLWNISPGPLAAALKRDFPEVEKSARINIVGALVRYGDKKFRESFYHADPDFLEIFSFPLKEGDSRVALTEPFRVLITESMRLKYFGEDDPLGKTLRVDNRSEYIVAGVLKDIPENSHLRFDFLASFSSLEAIWGPDKVARWHSNSFITYILLREGSEAGALEAKLPAFRTKYKGDKDDEAFLLQPLTSIHLHSSRIHDAVRGDVRQMVFLSMIALLIMLIACFNYMNLATGRASTRIKEVGLRKVVGADRRALIQQFMGESITLSLAALTAALVMARLLLPAFGSLMRRNLDFSLVLDPPVMLAAAGLTLLIGIISGSYPAVYLSSFPPSGILQSTGATGSQRPARLRNLLVILQFTATTILIVCTLVVRGQLNFMRGTDQGFAREEILNILIQDPKLKTAPEPLQKALMQIPGISDITISENLPTTIGSNSIFEKPSWGGPGAADKFYINWAGVDEHFLDFYNIEITAGRNFSREFSTDREAYIINQTAARMIDWENPVGKMLGDGSQKHRVIGVIQDFHFRPMRDEIEPLAISLNRTGRIRYISLKIETSRTAAVLASIEKLWGRFSPEYPLSFSFLDERMDRMYRSEKWLLGIINAFAALAVLLSVMGLFGLVLFTAERRTREIGIRKVLGASASSIVLMLSREFARWVLVADLIAWPVAYIAMQRWLAGFAYRTPLRPAVFVLAGILTLGIALLTVGYQSIRAAASDPVECLRYE